MEASKAAFCQWKEKWALLFTLFPSPADPTWLVESPERLEHQERTYSGNSFDFILVSLFLQFSPLQTATFAPPAPCQRAVGELPPTSPSPTSCGCPSGSGNEPQRTARLSWTAAEADAVRAWRGRMSTFPHSTAATRFFAEGS